MEKIKLNYAFKVIFQIGAKMPLFEVSLKIKGELIKNKISLARVILSLKSLKNRDIARSFTVRKINRDN